MDSYGGKTFEAYYKADFDKAIARGEVLAIYCHNIEEPADHWQLTPTLWNDMIANLGAHSIAELVKVAIVGGLASLED